MPPFQVKTHLEPNIIDQFFSAYEPDKLTELTMIQLRLSPLPDDKTVHRLANVAHQAWLDGKRSVLYAHLDENGDRTIRRFPLGVVTWWKELADVKTARARWQKSSESVAKQMHQVKFPDRELLAKQSWEHMNALPWNAAIRILDSLPS
ncbi:hypothetical protein BDZ89DRAFT_1080558 [Hymenopellis radicata]|nr:hypothetical protein BDZ89DRAFT_1080558 [Hymenopellis radicata]